MRAQIRFFRSRLEQFDVDTRAAIEVNVRDQIHWRDTVPLSPERSELADEIVAVLGDTGVWNMTSVLPELRALPSDLLLDGELVAWKGSEPYFPHVCRRVLNRDMSVPLTFVVFDLLRQNGVDLTTRPYGERRRKLERMKLDGGAWTTSVRFDDGRALFAAVCQLRGHRRQESLEPLPPERSRLGERQELEPLATGKCRDGGNASEAPASGASSCVDDPQLRGLWSRSSGHLVRSMGNRLVSIYLRDHHAASAGGLALARRALGRDHPLAEQIARDRQALEEVMRQLNVAPSPIKVGFVRIAELLGRLKLNGRVFQRSPLSRVLELEMLVVGIRGKEALWTSLLASGLSIQGIELEALVESAKEQGRSVEEQRVSAVASTFGERGV